MNFLFVLEYFNDSTDFTGGVEARSYYLAQELISQGHSVDVIASKNKEDQPYHSNIDGIHVFRPGPLHEYNNNGSTLTRLKVAIAFYNTLKKTNLDGYDLIDAQSFLSYLPVALACRKHKRKVCTYHESWIGEWIKKKGKITGIIGELLERATLKAEWRKIICVSDATRKRLEGKTKNQLLTIHNGIKQYPFKPAKLSPKGVLIIGRQVPTKNIDKCLKSLNDVKNMVTNFQISIVGEGPEHGELMRLADEFKLPVLFKDRFPDHKALINYMKAHHLFMTLSDTEGFNLTLAEAITSGLPYIASDIPAHKEVTRNGKGGILVNSDDEQAIRYALKKLLKGMSFYNQKKEECKQLKEHYDWKNSIKEYIEAAQ